MANVALKSITERKVLYETVVSYNKVLTLPYNGLYQIVLSGGGGGGGGASATDGAKEYGGGGGGSGGCIIVLRQLQSGDTVKCLLGEGGDGGGPDANGFPGEATSISINAGGVNENLSAPGGAGGGSGFNGGLGGLRGTGIGRDGQAGSTIGRVGGRGAIGSKYYAAGGNGSSTGEYVVESAGSSGQKGFVIITKVD